MKPTKKRKAPVKRENNYWCETCGVDTKMDFETTKEHLLTVHGINSATADFKTINTLHIDGQDYYGNNRVLTVLDPKGTPITLSNSTINPRSKNDLMRYG